MLEGVLEASWDDLDLEAHAGFLTRFARERGGQTNEVQRSWVLLPLFLHAAGGRAVHVVELGASAGLNLVFDRYRFCYRAGEWGPSDAPLELAGEERRPLPAELLELALEGHPVVGIDLDPAMLARARPAIAAAGVAGPWPTAACRASRNA